MRKLMLVLILALAGSAAGLFSAPVVEADDCATYCTSPNACAMRAATSAATRRAATDVA
jgi:hypothetical protein